MSDGPACLEGGADPGRTNSEVERPTLGGAPEPTHYLYPSVIPILSVLRGTI